MFCVLVAGKTAWSLDACNAGCVWLLSLLAMRDSLLLVIILVRLSDCLNYNKEDYYCIIINWK